jgi:hypothetical protein
MQDRESRQAQQERAAADAQASGETADMSGAGVQTPRQPRRGRGTKAEALMQQDAPAGTR